jgi:hypothetical protein
MKSKSVWEQVHTFQDPESGLGVIISERIRGKHSYSIQIVQYDEMGATKHLETPHPKSSHNIEDVVYSLCKAARQYIETKARDTQIKKRKVS